MARQPRQGAVSPDGIEAEPLPALSAAAPLPHAATIRDTFRRAPSELDAFLFEFAALAGRRVLRTPGLGRALRSVGHAAAAVLEAISPALPFRIREHSSLPGDPWGFYLNIFKYCVPLTIFFCLVMNAALSAASGTFASMGGNAAANQLYFMNDGYNIILYLIVCPLYVSAAICVISTAAVSWSKLNEYSSSACGPEWRPNFNEATRFTAFVASSFLLSGLFIAQYISDLTDPFKTPTLYWFFDLVGSARVLNPAGAYYLFMNSVLLFITAMAAFCYITMSIEMFRLGRHLSSSAFAIADKIDPVEAKQAISDKERELRRELADFSYCYVWAKFLILMYAINIWIWQLSPAGAVQNMHAAIFALVVVGVFVLVIPRLYLSSKWHNLKSEYLERLGQPSTDEEIEYRDIRGGAQRKISLWLDIVFGLLVVVIVGYQYDYRGITEWWLELQRAWWPR